MSWIVRNLILDRNQIISNISKEHTISGSEKYENSSGEPMYADVKSICFRVDFENDEWHFLIQVESKIKEMFESKQLTEKEVNILWLLSEGNSYKEVGKELNIGKSSVRKIFNSTCGKIAFALGGVFTDEGYVEYMAEKHSLTDVEISKMVTLMESNRRL